MASLEPRACQTHAHSGVAVGERRWCRQAGSRPSLRHPAAVTVVADEHACHRWTEWPWQALTPTVASSTASSAARPLLSRPFLLQVLVSVLVSFGGVTPPRTQGDKLVPSRWPRCRVQLLPGPLTGEGVSGTCHREELEQLPTQPGWLCLGLGRLGRTPNNSGGTTPTVRTP